MSQQRRHSGFATFSDDATKSQFVSTVLERDPALKRHAYIPGNRPTIIFEELSDIEQQKLVALLQGHGQWIEDVQFESMG